MPLPHAEILSLHGPDAAAFAHAQLSSDIHALPVGQWQWSAWLDPRGRTRAVFNVMRPEPSRLLLLLRGGRAEDIANGLRPYVMRSRVTLEVPPPRPLLDAAPMPERQFEFDDGMLALGMGGYALRVPATGPVADDEPQPQAWRRAAIEAGHPWLPDAALEQILAPSLALQRLGGISLDKGCFPGQEIVARLHYRGGCKQHLRHLQTDAPLSPGTTLTQQGRAVGTVLDSIMENGVCHFLAVVRDTVPHTETGIEAADSTHIMRTINALQ